MKTMTALIILDGFGVNAETKEPSVDNNNPHLDALFAKYTRLAASGWR